MESQGSTFPSSQDAHDSFFSHLPLVPEPHIYAVMRAYAADSNPVKLNLGMGVYRTEEGKPYVLPVVREAEQILLNDMSYNKEYLPTTGGSEFNTLTAKLVFGSASPAIMENRVITTQCLSGTGSMRIGAEILAKYYKQRVIYISQPTYRNHPNFFIATGIEVRTYRYYDEVESCLDIQGLLEDLSSAPEGAIVLLQASAHNPTGVDPTIQQWEKIRQLMRSKQLLPFFDNAYQGFASGDLDQDAQPIRMFVADGGECLVAHSYSKIMGLYGERVGTLSIVCKTAEVASKLDTQLKVEISSMYLTPPIHGAAIVTTILGNRDMRGKWIIEINKVVDRLKRIRQQLYDALCDKGTPGDWSYILRQVGMYTLSGLKEKQIAFMTKEFHIYMSSDGRINIGGLGSKTVPYLADAIHAAVTHVV